MISEKYKYLIAGILEQTSKEYREALIKKDYGKITYLENWFRSEWGQLLSMGNGDLIIKRIREETKANGGK